MTQETVDKILKLTKERAGIDEQLKHLDKFAKDVESGQSIELRNENGFVVLVFKNPIAIATVMYVQRLLSNREQEINNELDRL